MDCCVDTTIVPLLPVLGHVVAAMCVFYDIFVLSTVVASACWTTYFKIILTRRMPSSGMWRHIPEDGILHGHRLRFQLGKKNFYV
jgi:hypothetical protein